MEGAFPFGGGLPFWNSDNSPIIVAATNPIHNTNVRVLRTQGAKNPGRTEYSDVYWPG